MSRITKTQLLNACDASSKEGYYRGYEEGRKRAVREMQDDLKAKQADMKLKLMNSLGQSLQANSQGLEAVCRLLCEIGDK